MLQIHYKMKINISTSSCNIKDNPSLIFLDLGLSDKIYKFSTMRIWIRAGDKSAHLLRGGEFFFFLSARSYYLYLFQASEAFSTSAIRNLFNFITVRLKPVPDNLEISGELHRLMVQPWLTREKGSEPVIASMAVLIKCCHRWKACHCRNKLTNHTNPKSVLIPDTLILWSPRR